MVISLGHCHSKKAEQETAVSVVVSAELLLAQRDIIVTLPGTLKV